MVKSKAVQGHPLRLLYLDLNRVAVLRRLYFQGLDRFPSRSTLLHLDEHVRLVPRLDLDRTVECRQVEGRCAGDRESLFVAGYLRLRVERDGAGRGDENRGEQRATRENGFHTPDRRCGWVWRSRRTR